MNILTSYQTTTGYQIGIGRLPRSVVDSFLVAHPEPQPPKKQIETWDGSIEELPDFSDPSYLLEMNWYYVNVVKEQIDLIVPSVSIQERPSTSDLDEMRDAGIVSSERDELRYLVLSNENDAVTAVSIVWYNSTVTQQGIEEAAERLAVEWMGRNVLNWASPPDTGMSASSHYRDKMSALYAGYKWNEFCNLYGWEQSEIVALYLIKDRVEWLKQQKR